MEANNTMKKFVVFKLENEEYGIDILRVKEIKEVLNITRVPKAAPFVKGVINLRGEVIPIVDLRKKFNLPKAENIEKKNSRIIFISMDEMNVGLMVDTSSEVLEINNEAIEEAPSAIGNIEQSYINGIGKVDQRLIILLDVAKILNN